MIKYVIRRLILTVFVVVCSAILVFLLMYAIPGDPAQILLGPDATPAQIAAKRADMGLDRPLLVQLGEFMYNGFLHGDFGTSWFRGTSVIGGMLERIPRTFFLGFINVVIATIIGIPLGVTAAIHRSKWQDRGLMVGTMVLTSIPHFWLAMMLIYVFALKLGWFPSFGIGSWDCYVLPILSSAIGGFCLTARQTRASVLDVVNADYITTARAKGVKEHDVIYKHMLPNALIPIITLIGANLAHCIGGTIVKEKIFSFPGVGLYMSDAISSRDYPIVRGCIIIISAFTALMMLLTDVAYAFVDPRIKAQYINSARKKGKIRV